ncbi:putative quinol monooxygenase, partial [Streptomyces scopuliridis]|uniref:putative quinol monooxygenase n=1 Tax=Streptomyces scopuliridis TaxID=452529 RepID=UPI0036A18304
CSPGPLPHNGHDAMSLMRPANWTNPNHAMPLGDDRLVEIEKWSSPEALDAHLKGPAVGQLLKEIEGKIVGELDGQVLRPHPAGTPQQGAL